LLGGIVLSAIGVVVALRAQTSYVEALEQSLMARAIELDEPSDRTTRRTVEAVAMRVSHPPFRAPGLTRQPPERELERLAQLRSNDPKKLRAALKGPLTPAIVAHALPLLVREDVGPDARHAIATYVQRFMGQLCDALRDTSLPVDVRCQLPSLIAKSGDPIAHARLLAALDDPEFEVRFRAAQALLAMLELDPALALDPLAVFEGVRRELEDVRRNGAWDSASRSAEHVATLLALALPPEPVRTAFLGLLSEDPSFRGVALEYLENVLPEDIRDRMWMVLAIEAAPTTVERRSVDAVRADLLQVERLRRSAETQRV
jgi:hypothetical protein